jgi:hypothetical protein
VTTTDFGRYAISFCATVAMLAGCSQAQPSVTTVGVDSPWQTIRTAQKTFHYVASKQKFKVPANVTEITVVARGAAGGGNFYRGRGGYGGRVYAIIPVRPGERLAIFVGGAASGDNSMNGGFNGGANGGGPYSCCMGSGGGGASDVREGADRLSDRILVAGGGGGRGGGNDGGGGGGGGGRIGGSGGAALYCGAGGGTGGTQILGGSGGAGGQGSPPGGPGADGERGYGGIGGPGGPGTSSLLGSGGGGGGGGYFGGGGGGGGAGYCASPGGGGGGGSSYVEPNAKTFRFWQGWKNATTNGLVVISW